MATTKLARQAAAAFVRARRHLAQARRERRHACCSGSAYAAQEVPRLVKFARQANHAGVRFATQDRIDQAAKELRAERRRADGTLQRRGTCQVCGRSVAVDRHNVAALHGYTRPGYGWIQGRCFGAGQPVFEVGRDTLGAWIGMVEAQREQSAAYLARLDAGTVTEVSIFPTPTADPVVLSAEAMAVTGSPAALFARRRSWFTFAQVLAARRFAVDGDLRHLDSYLAELRARFAGWSFRPEAIVTVE